MTKATLSRAGIFPALVCFGMLLTACSARAPLPEAPRPDSLRTEAVAPGVTHEYRWFANGPVAIHSVIIDPKACGIDLRAVKAAGRVFGQRVPTSAIARQTEADLKRDVLAATNADFFSYEWGGLSEGPQISNGTLIKTEGVHREAIEDRLVRLQPVFAFTRDRKSHITFTKFSGTVRTRTASTALTGINVRAVPNGAVLYTHLWADATPADTGTLELVLRSVSGSAVSGRAVVTSMDTAVAPVAIQADGYVLRLRGTARSVFNARAGDTLQWSGAFAGLPANVTELIAGYPMLLQNGRAVHHDEAGLRTSFADNRHPRSVITHDSKGRIHIFAIDGRQPGYSVGMSLQELGDYLIKLGFKDALNFDGGGSTTLVVNDRIVNKPSDAAGERAVSNALVVLGASAGSCR